PLLCFRRDSDPERDENSFWRAGFNPHLALRVRLSLARERIKVRVAREQSNDFVGDRLRGLRTDFPVAIRTERAGNSWPEQLQIIIDLRHRPDSGTRRLDRVRLLNSDRRRDSTDVVHPRLIHAVEELPHVRAERLNVAPLAFRINCLESETRFAAATRPRDNRQFSERKINIDPLKIVLTRAANFDAVSARCRANAFSVPDLRTHRKYSLPVKRF